MSAEQSNNTVEFSLATILNILWRRRLIVLGLPALGLIVGLLYGVFGTRRWSATATVRPGITAYSLEGQPIRQWQLRDITTWYEKEFYQQELNRRLGLPANFRAKIRTEFIATGLTNLAGGEVVTLWTTGVSPELAAALIDTSIAMFKEYAEGDTLSSQIQLTKDGLKLQIEMLETRFLSVDKKEVSLNLRLMATRADSLVISVLGEELGIEMEMINRRQDFYRSRIKDLVEVRPTIYSQLEQINQLFDSVLNNDGDAFDSSSIPAWVRRDAVLDDGDVMDGLAEVRLQVQQQLNHNAVKRDSFTYELELASLEYQRRQIKREATVKSKLREVEQKIGDLKLERDFELPVKRREVRTDINSRRVQLNSLTSLQRVGPTIISEKPVRPRGGRATLILVFLGIVGGLVLGFAWDYLEVNRREIFRS